MLGWFVALILATWIFLWALCQVGRSVPTEDHLPLAFISGPYRAATRRGVYANIRKAAEIAVAVAEKGYCVFTPHTNSHLPGLLGNLPDEYWLCMDIEVLSRCDLLVLVPGWHASAGTIDEVAFARDHGIPVYELADLPEAD